MTKRFSPLVAALICFLPLTACASSGNDWPSLRTPAERRTGTCDNIQLALADTAGATLSQAAPSGEEPPQRSTPSVAAVTARLAEERRDFEAATREWANQRTVAEKAASAARDTAPASEAWATAELEISRLNQTAARFDETRATVDRLAGELAVLAASGAKVQDALVQAGQLLNQIQAAQEAHTSALSALQANQRR